MNRKQQLGWPWQGVQVDDERDPVSVMAPAAMAGLHTALQVMGVFQGFAVYMVAATMNAQEAFLKTYQEMQR